MIARSFSAALLCLVSLSAAAAQSPAVNESAREIPLAYRVDVVVVGGSTGAVSAAVAAAESGAKVFLAAPRPYLGDDMTATLRLWPEAGRESTSPLAKRIFDDPARTVPEVDPNRLDFTYTADLPSAGVHRDARPPRLLTDGRWSDPTRQSVEYDGDVNIVADLHQSRPIDRVRLMAFQRSSGVGGTNFKVHSVTISVSRDNQSWKEVAVVKNEKADDGRCTLSARLGAEARYVKLSVKKTDEVERILLGEIEIVRPASGDAPAAAKKLSPPRPLHVKRVLDEALLAAGVDFLYGCYATDVLRDASGNPRGVVIANRAGRQAAVAKTIIDATDGAVVARMAGAKFRPFRKGVYRLRRVVIGGGPRTGPHMTHRVIDPPFSGPFPNRAGTSAGEFKIIEYAIDLPVEDTTYAAYAELEQQARSMTYHPEQQFTADRLIGFPYPPIVGRCPDAEGKPEMTVADVPLAACRPDGVERLLVLGRCADFPAGAPTESFTRVPGLIDLGARIGKAAAAEAKSLPSPKGAKLPGQTTDRPVAGGDVREVLRGVRPIQKLPTVPQEARALPVLGRYDVVVIGGGTAGAPAGIAAARQGAKTLVVEYLHGLGGVGTVGAICKYYWGNRVGFTATVGGGNAWIIEQKIEWYRTELLKAGADIWYGTLGCGALVEGERVTGAVVATPDGRGVVLAKVVIDTTGNADVAAAAGAECRYTDATEFGMQGTGLPPRRLGATYANTDFSICDETDMLDVWQFFVYAKDKYPDAFDQGQLVDTRERRRIVGEATLTPLDEMLGRTWPDTIVRTHSNFDTHGYTIDPLLEFSHPNKSGFYVDEPYRCLLPKGLEGILVGGLGLSAHRDALPLVRMQADMQNQGYAAGVAAAMAARENTTPRRIDVRALQKHLVKVGNLPESVLTDVDSFPLPDERVADAVKYLGADRKGAAVILAQPDRALPLLRAAYGDAEEKDKLAYAHLLAVMGDATGLETLAAEVDGAPEWDAGWNYRGMGQFGNAFSPLDTLIVALGRTRDRRAAAVILRKLRLLSAESDFSHHRAVGLALELIGDKAAAKPLAELLQKPGIRGHVIDTIQKARQYDRQSPGGTNAVKTRRESLRELMLARALYRCGDYEGLGKKILTEYTKDLRGHLARHAEAVLREGKK